MARVELLSVLDRFQITNVRLVLMPDFSVPAGTWANREELVLVMTPQGHEFEVRAQFNLTHFNIRDLTVPIDRRWRIQVALPDALKEQVPLGSKILVTPETRAAVSADGV